LLAIRYRKEGRVVNPRSLLAIASAATLAIASPAFGRSDDAARLGRAMQDPAAQQATASAAAAMSEALLNIRVAPLIEAIEAIEAAHGANPGDVDPNLTLRDYAGPEAERVPEEVSRRLPAMMGAMGAMTGTLETMLPQLRETAKIMRDQMDEALERR
jgi:hypothetical protein